MRCSRPVVPQLTERKVPLKPRKADMQAPQVPAIRERAKKRPFTIVTLEERIAPVLRNNHNEILVRDTAKAVKPPQREKKRPFKVVKLEERITPTRMLNHNET